MEASLEEIKNKLAAYEIVYCGMHHEKVALDPDSGKPLSDGDPNNPVYQRVALCDTSLRRVRLGCSHTSANNAFGNQLAVLCDTHPEFQPLKQKFDNKILALYSLDHRKGNLEAELAGLLDGRLPANKEKIETQLEQCVTEHGGLMSDLKTIRDNILIQINAILGHE